MTTTEPRAESEADVRSRLDDLVRQGLAEFHPRVHHGPLPRIVLARPVKDLQRIIRAAKR